MSKFATLPAGKAKESKASESLQAGSLIESKLPEELLSLVFVHLSPAELVTGPARICQRWQKACLQPVVWADKFGFDGLCLKRQFSGRWDLPRLFKATQRSNLLALPDQSSFPRSTCRHKRLQTLITPGKWMLLADHGNDVELVPHARYGLPPEKIHPDLALYPQQPTASYGVKSAVQVVDLRAAFLTAGMSLEAAEAALDTSPSLQLHGRIGDSRKGYATGRGLDGLVGLCFGATPEETLGQKWMSGFRISCRDEVVKTWLKDAFAVSFPWGEQNAVATLVWFLLIPISVGARHAIQRTIACLPDPVLLGFHAPTQSSNQPVSQKEYGMANEGMPGVALIGWLTLT
ncbi:hypothetical protein WJX74_000628 [Apatococcus lobatus]|uniref:F-box domain-containing protein n=1 Tax=Apatococcus lobatus TaxID=904363 RepID=A0AAW1RS04_9CHLO